MGVFKIWKYNLKYSGESSNIEGILHFIQLLDFDLLGLDSFSEHPVALGFNISLVPS